MWNWFQSPASCPVTEFERGWIESRWHWLREEFGDSALTTAEVVLPCDEFFPDPYHHRPQDGEVMLTRLCEYLEIDRRRVELAYFDNLQRGAAELGVYRADDSSGMFVRQGEQFLIGVERYRLSDPLALAAALIHELGHVILLGEDRVSVEEEDLEPLTDLATLFLGMGVMSANATLREFYSDEGLIGRWSISRMGCLTGQMYGYALARFALDRGEIQPEWLPFVRPNIRAEFKLAVRYLTAVEKPE